MSESVKPIRALPRARLPALRRAGAATSREEAAEGPAGVDQSLGRPRLPAADAEEAMEERNRR
jgi:hypothetical protein